jgi:N-acetylglucosaminyldiphosphoundecaprenol N-acetyl-beta-D-mannosaminyltransferase
VVDGFGLYFTLSFFHWRGTRITGALLTEKLVSLAESSGQPVSFILCRSGLSAREELVNVIRGKYPRLLFDISYDDEVSQKKEAKKYALTLIALGAPEQEYRAETVREGVVMGVGGTFDFWTGRQKRAPKIFQKIGMEWSWRCWHQPARLGRIWRAVGVFPVLVLRARLLQ